AAHPEAVDRPGQGRGRGPGPSPGHLRGLDSRGAALCLSATPPADSGPRRGPAAAARATGGAGRPGGGGGAMRALVFDESLSLVEGYPRPEPGPGEALVRVRLAGICNTDLEITRGYMGF